MEWPYFLQIIVNNQLDSVQLSQHVFGVRFFERGVHGENHESHVKITRENQITQTSQKRTAQSVCSG